MTGGRILAVAVAFALTASVSAQALIESWHVNVLNCEATDNGWLKDENRGHSIDFIPAAASANTYARDVVVLLTEEHATARIRVLDAATGEHLDVFETVPTGDSFREHARMRASDDGYIYVTSSAGRVQQYDLAGTWLGNMINEGAQVDPGLTRAMAVTGSHTENTLRIYVARGNKVAIFGWEGEAVFQYIGTVSTSLTGDIMTLAAVGDRVYCGSIPTSKIFLHEVTYAPFSFEPGVEIEAYDGAISSGIDVSAAGSEFAVIVAETLNNQCGVGNVDATGAVFTNIAPIPDFDFNGDGLFDGGSSGRFKNLGGTADICIEPGGVHAYAYSPHTNPPASPPSAAVMKISISSTAATDEWMLYY